MENTTDTPLSRSAILDQPARILPFSEVLAGGYRVIDVRAPKEFADGSLPGAVNIPIFDNDERCLVGTIYREGGRDFAIDTGFDLIEPRLVAFVEGFMPYRADKLAIFCARGGMRSRSVVNLLAQHGFMAVQLAGGYKQYRQELIALLEEYAPRCIVLHGLTGTGKTRLLDRLQPTIDLEDLAQHQSSLFGGLNRQPRSQKWFDAYFHQLIPTLGEEPYFIEGESRQLGNIYLPGGIARAMKGGKLVMVTASLATRVARIVEDYPIEDEATVRQVEGILKSLKRKVGSDLVMTMCDYLHQGRLAELVETLLVEYYDKRYSNCFDQYSFDMTISSEDLEEAAQTLAGYRDELIARGVTW